MNWVDCFIHSTSAESMEILSFHPSELDSKADIMALSSSLAWLALKGQYQAHCLNYKCNLQHF